MDRYLGQALVHSVVAALAVEALALMWREQAPARRIRLRLLALAAPLLPLFDLLPLRRQEWFEERFALLSGRHWAELVVAGVQPYAVFLAGASALGAALFLADLAEMIRHRRVAAAPHGDLRLAGLVDELAARLGMSAPAVLLAERVGPALFCRGRTVVVSRRALDLLDEQELRAALAHELAHLKARDPLLRWGLFGFRALQGANPVAQVMVRAIARDEERRADDAGALACGDRLALASAIVKLYRAQGHHTRHHAAAIEERCRRLLAPAPQPPPFGRARLCAAGVSLAGLLFFVV